MQTAMTFVEVFAVCAALLVGFLAVTFFRSRRIARGGHLTICAVRRGGLGPWRHGVLRLEDDAMLWYPLFGLRPTPRHRWARHTMELGSCTPPGSGGPALALVGPTAVIVPFTGAEASGVRRLGPDTTEDVELAVAAEPYMALRAWVEAAPPLHRPLQF